LMSSFTQNNFYKYGTSTFGTWLNSNGSFMSKLEFLVIYRSSFL